MSENFNQLGAALQERYQLKAELGRGGMATVYLAQDLQHGRRVAVKVLHPELAGAVGHDRFLREIRIASDLSHPHILPLLDSGSAVSGNNTLPFYVMPFVEGESLRARLQRERQLPIEEAMKIAHDVATALSYAHAHGVVHRDIKPENILLAGNEAVVADFGIARAIDRAVDAEVITSAGLAVGTPAYMSPEQGAGHHEVDGRSDIYSLGCVLYEMLGGDPPFTGPSANAILARHRVDPVLPLRTIRPSVPASLEAVVLQALEKVPADRFKTAYLFAAALGQQHTPSGSTPREPSGDRAPASSRAATVATPIPKWRHGRLRQVAVRVVVAGAFLVAAWWAIGKATGTAKAHRYSDIPTWSAWRGWTGEFFPVFAVTDSLLVVRTQGNENPQAFDGERWMELTVPDSFGLLRYVGALAGHRLLATKSVKDGSGQPQMQYWWMALSPGSLRPDEPVGTTLPDDDVRPYWWSDGTNLILWQEAIRRLENENWVREATGTTGGYADLWGIDLQQRFAIPSSGDSLLIFDGISWKSVDIMGPGSAGQPAYRAGTSFLDGATVVLGDECIGEDQCRPVVLQQDSFAGPWRRVALPRSVGIPLEFPPDTASLCSISRFSLQDVAGRNGDDYFIWGSWSSCDPGEERETTGCPLEQPCMWHVGEGKMEPVEDLRGKMIQAVGYLDANAYALLDDGTVWREVDRHWRVVTQVPHLPARLLGASSRVIVRLAGGAIRYEPSQTIEHTPLIVRQIDSLPLSVRAGQNPRRLLVRDSTVALLTSEGQVFVSRCRIDRVAPLGRITGPPAGALLCPPWQQLPPPLGRILDIDILPNGEVIGVGPPGLVVSWTNGLATVETLPGEVRQDSLWDVAVSGRGRTIAIGSTVVLERDSTRRWSVVRRISPVNNQNARFLPLPDGDLVIVERSIQVWDRSADSLPVAILFRPGLGDASIGALHALPDGRLIAGLANPDEPLVGGWLMVWAAPARANQAQRVELPLSVDITDLADDGRYLHVVGRGGTLKIPLDSLPFPPARPD